MLYVDVAWSGRFIAFAGKDCRPYFCFSDKKCRSCVRLLTVLSIFQLLLYVVCVVGFVNYLLNCVATFVEPVSDLL